MLRNADCRARWDELLHCRSGSVATTLAVSMIAVFGFAALAVDYGLWSRRKAQLQIITDAAALAGARVFATGDESIAALVNAYLSEKGIANSQYQVVTQSTDRRVMVSVSELGQQAFIGVLGIKKPTLRVVAAAESVGSANACLIALDRQAAVGIDFSLGGSIQADRCAIWSNSASASSIEANGSGNVSAAQICAVGGLSKGSLDLNPAVQTGCDPIADPLAAWSPSLSSLCHYTNFQVPASGGVTLSPGTYCGGLRINGSVQVTLRSGTYTMRDGGLKVNGGASLAGDEVTIVMSGANSSVDFSGSSNIQLSAPSSGSTQGLVLAAGRGEPVATSKIGGGSNVSLEGSLYLPTHDLAFGGNSTANSPPPFAVMIAKTLRFLGGATVTLRADTSARSYPSYVARATKSVRLVK